ncbi:MAG: hypothetical protein H6559_13170 [Lewinellaceae bacterium]|nr:hypothetical protein [Lewinellaceae bacterium]
MPIPARTIQEVIDALGHIIATCEEKGSRQAYFALLYKSMTEAVRDAILAGHFEDGPRMEKLDVLFANRYLVAWQQHRQGLPATRSWQIAFDAAGDHSLIVLQHLILGVNTHINLDLGIAAALTAPGDDIAALQRDFEKINDIIATLTGTMQAKLERIWWPMRLLRRLTKNREQAVIEFSIAKAREGAWANANALSQILGPARPGFGMGSVDTQLTPKSEAYINTMDEAVAVISRRVARPRRRITKILLSFVRWWEPREVGRVIELLK